MVDLQRLRRAVALLTFALLPIIGPLTAARADAIDVHSKLIVLDTAQPERTQLGLLVYRGGLVLSSRDPRFGGLSGLRVDTNGKRFVAVNDTGTWMTGALRYDAQGMLVGVADVAITPLRDGRGQPFVDKYNGDAESLTLTKDGYIVGLEQRHRLLRYRRVDGPSEPIAAPPGLKKAPANGGLETVTTLADGRLLAITETWDVNGGVRAWVGPSPWRSFVWPTSEGFRPTDAATLPDGDVLVLERRFPLLAARIRRLNVTQLRSNQPLRPTEIARFEGSINFDNMEALSVRQGTRGETLVYVASDDNQNFFQRSLLMMFELDHSAP